VALVVQQLGENLLQRHKKMKLLKKKQTEDTQLDTDNIIKKNDRTTKEHIVAQLLSRWWYSDMYIESEWPPQEEEYYQVELQRRKLRKVTIREWEWLPEEDDRGRRKVYELSQFRGLFRNSAGDLIDLRPKDTCPCLDNFMKKDIATLCRMLISAYKNQLKDLLGNSRYRTDNIAGEIRAAMVKVKQLLREAESGRKS